MKTSAAARAVACVDDIKDARRGWKGTGEIEKYAARRKRVSIGRRLKVEFWGGFAGKYPEFGIYRDGGQVFSSVGNLGGKIAKNGQKKIACNFSVENANILGGGGGCLRPGV